MKKEKIDQAAHICPSPRQLAWQQLELSAFFHFTVNTFTDKEWGTGDEDPAIFNPTFLDTNQWLQAISDAGFKLAIITAKHHDGFCLWPSRYTDHSVKNSAFKAGRGDVVREFVNACHTFDVKVGFYLSPWDRHEPTYGTAAYNDYFVNQLTELLTGYGPIAEVWFDGACGEGSNGKKQHYDWSRYYSVIRKLQPDAVIAIAGPDVRWVGNEQGIARKEEWSVVPASVLDQDKLIEDSQQAVDKQPVIQDARQRDLGSRKVIAGVDNLVWYPAECDVSIRPGWFYHCREDALVKSSKNLVSLYYKSVGRNAGLLLNIPPDRRGMIHDKDICHLRAMHKTLSDTFETDLAVGARVETSHAKKGYTGINTIDDNPMTYWTPEDWQESAELVYQLGSEIIFDVILLQEYITVGQRIEKFTVYAHTAQEWHRIIQGSTVGYKRLLRCEQMRADKVKVIIEASRFAPTLSKVGIYKQP